MKKKFSLFKILFVCCLYFIILFQFACTQSKELGSKENPFKFYLVPAQDAITLQESAKVFEKYLNEETKMHVKVEIPVNYIALVEAFGSKRADAAIVNTFGYILANEKYGVQARLRMINRGRDEYYGQIIAHVDGVKSISEINGKSFAFVDPASTSGYLLPMRLFKQENIKLKDEFFAGKHDTVVLAVYQKKVAAGATFYTPPDADGTPKDARWLLRTQFPDVYDKVKILKLTGPIPNDPLAFRKDVPEEMKDKIIQAMKKYIKTPEGQATFKDMFHITDFKDAHDKDYDIVRGYLKDLGKDAKSFMK